MEDDENLEKEPKRIGADARLTGYKVLFVLVFVAFVVSRLTKDDGPAETIDLSTEIQQEVNEFKQDMQKQENKDKWILFERMLGGE